MSTETETESWDAQVGANVQRIRLARGMTQADVAEEMTRRGIPLRQQQIQKIEKGQRPLRFREADQLASVLDVPLDLITEEEFVIDRSALIVSHTASAWERWEQFAAAANNFLDQLGYLQGNLDSFMREPENAGIPDSVINDARVILRADLTKILEGIQMERQAKRAIDEAQLHGSVSNDFIVAEKKAASAAERSDG